MTEPLRPEDPDVEVVAGVPVRVRADGMEIFGVLFTAGFLVELAKLVKATYMKGHDL